MESMSESRTSVEVSSAQRNALTPPPPPSQSTRPITSVLPQDAWTVFTNAMLLIHCLVAYQVCVSLGPQGVWSWRGGCRRLCTWVLPVGKHLGPTAGCSGVSASLPTIRLCVILLC